MSLRRLLVAFAAGTVAALILALAAAAMLSLAPPERLAGTWIGLGPLEVFSVSGVDGSTVVELGPGAMLAAVGLGVANAAAAAVLARRSSVTAA